MATSSSFSFRSSPPFSSEASSHPLAQNAIFRQPLSPFLSSGTSTTFLGSLIKVYTSSRPDMARFTGSSLGQYLVLLFLHLQAIVKETFRLHPSVPIIPRTSTEDCIVGGYHIPAKTTAFMNIWAIGRDPNHWDNPLEFIPERFEEISMDVRGQHFQMLPFGSGRRMCPGMSLALQVVPVTLGAMIQCFEWKAGQEGDLDRVDMEEGAGLTLVKANPLVCVPVARLDSLIS